MYSRCKPHLVRFILCDLSVRVSVKMSVDLTRNKLYIPLTAYLAKIEI